MSDFKNGFVKIETPSYPTWNPCTTKDPNGIVIPRIKGDDSYIVGYYVNTDIRQNKQGKDFTIHNIILEEVGSKEHLSKDAAKGDVVSLFGKTALDEKILKNVSAGQMIMLTWEGKFPSKQNPGQGYHLFDVSVNPNFSLTVDEMKAKLSGSAQQAVNATATTSTPTQTQQAPVANTAPVAVLDDADDDDLPF
jgi:hypothetical protein